MQPEQFQQAVLAWFDQHGRQDLPWQNPITPYRVWVSEVMLQQTQVSTVIPYFTRFMQAFPRVETLASAPLDQVLHHWTGLGYYARARNLHQAAGMIVAAGEFPDSLEKLEQLPGVGRSTAGAILSIAFGRRAPILDGNVKRVLARVHALDGWPGRSGVLRELWRLADYYTPTTRLPAYTQAMMDLGATLCTRSRPDCSRCPLNDHCQGYQQGNPTRYPGAKPARALPQKQRWWLVLEGGEGQLLLERRANQGLWGGLWCLPEFDSEHSLMSWLAISGLPHEETLKPLPDVRHSFSHFQLRARPLHLRLDKTPQGIMDDGRRVWYNLAEPLELGLAAPVQKLLYELAAQRSTRNA